MMDLTNRHIRASYALMEEMARRARESRSELVAVIDAGMTDDDRYNMPWLTLSELYRKRGWKGDGAEHRPALRRDGWVRIEQGGAWFWLLARGTKYWISPSYLLERCAACVEADTYACRCIRTNDLNKRTKLYVLAQEHGAFYVGTSRTPMIRFEKHCSPKGGSLWTRKHRPLRIGSVRLVERAISYDEESRTTLNLMRRYGVDRVQGGQFVGEKGWARARELLAREEAERDGSARKIALTFKDLEEDFRP